MGVYRLLHHSLGDRALAAQLKGDLLLCFNEDEEAVKQYVEAAEIYHKENRLIESIAVYEHLLYLNPGNRNYLRELLDLYKNIEMPFNMVGHIQILIKDNKIDLAIEIADHIADTLSLHENLKVRKKIVFALLNADEIAHETAEKQLEVIIEDLLASDDQSMMQQFLSELKAVSNAYHTKACSYISE